MKKLLIPAFACTAAMLIACGDDSSSAKDATESNSNNWAHEPVGEYFCNLASDSTTVIKNAYEGPDSAMEVIRYEYPRVDIEGVEKVCEKTKANKTDEQEVTCEELVEISNPSKTMTFDSLKALMTEECYKGIVINAVDLTNQNKAPENKYCVAGYCANNKTTFWGYMLQVSKKIADGVKSLF